MKLFNYVFSDRKKSFLVLLLALLSLSPAYADQGYTVFDSSTGTLTFKYGTPTGTLNTDYYNTDNTGMGSPDWSMYPWPNGIKKLVTKVVFEPSFASARPTSCQDWFSNCSNLTEIEGIEYLNTENVAYMGSMFRDCSKLASLDLTHFNTAKVTRIRSMFEGCSSLTSLDLSSFNTEKVEDMENMFYGCSSLTSLDVSSFNTSKVTTMYQMFRECEKLTTLDLSNFNTQNVTNMTDMFEDCGRLTTLDISNFNTGKVRNMYRMFYHCGSLTTLDVSSFNTQNVTSMTDMFGYCSSLTSLDLSNFNTAKVIGMGGMFYRCGSLTTLDVSNFNTENVTYMFRMFNGCSSLTSLDLSSFNTEKVEDMENMFYDCSSLTSPDVSSFNTQNVTNMCEMFSTCPGLTTLDLSSFNTANVHDMREMIAFCGNLTSVTFGPDFSIASSSYKTNMFRFCSKLRYIDFFDSDDTDAITEVNRSSAMFNNVPQTTVIYLPHGSQNVTNVRNVVYSKNGDETDLWCPEYYSEDKVDIEFPRNFQAYEAKYSRSMNATTKYGTTILPYAFESNDEVQAYTLHHELTDAMYFAETSSVPAHTPFFYKKKDTSATTVNFNMADATNGITVYATHTTSAAEGGEPYQTGSGMTDWATKGYYITETIDAYNNGTFYISGDKFLKAMGTVKMNPHRVTFHGEWTMEPSTSSGSNIMPFELLGSGDVTDEIINAFEASDLRKEVSEARTIYDAQGRQHSELQKGLNIIRRKDGSAVKVIIR